ncbi:MAG: TIGR03960 family B12-binding radical SAM protein [Potamolinea sp.]
MALTVEEILTKDIIGPARYLGNELGAVHKPWEDAKVRWVLTYPEIYEVGASNLGHIILYNILNAQPRQLSDRAYLPAPDLAKKLRESQTPLFAVENRRSLRDFDILGFSLSYELGATNILEMLDLAGIPLTWQQRNEGESKQGLTFPLIFAGGQTATSNPEPYADFFDFIALGDGEELLPEIGLILEEGKAAGLSREALLFDLAQIPGVYVPQFYDSSEDGSVHPNRPDVPKRILRRVATPMPAYSIGLVPYVETVHDRLTIEIRRGCTRGCRFCQPGMLTRPARDVEPQQVVEAIEKGMRATGYNEFSLLSLSCSDYLALPAVGMEIKNRLKDENITLTLPSQRVDRFDENIANIIGGTRQGGLTFAPEAGTQRMRDIVNKGLTNEELLRGVKTAFEQGWDRIKLYFMIGLPGETDVDVLGIAETVRWLQQECWVQGKRKLNFNLTISNFTPKPHTPFQWHSVSTSEFKRKQELLRNEFRHMRGVKVNFTDVRISAMEDFVGRGDRRLSAVLGRAWELGAGMDAWFDNLTQAFGAWEKAIAESDLTWKYRQVENGEWNVFHESEVTNHENHNQEEASTSQNSLEAPLPWDHIDTGIDKNWLIADLQKALEAATVPDCSFEGCSHCGICGTDFGHNIVIEAPPIPQFAGHFQPDQEKVQRLRMWFGKLGDMALVSHLDLVRLFDRAVRRASLPIAYTNGFHPSPRIIIANALSLGATSHGEIVDFELTKVVAVEDFKEKLAAQLPKNLPVYQVEEIDLKAPAATKVLEQAEYLITVANSEDSWEQWQDWVEQVKGCEAILWEQITKAGKKKQVNLKERLFDLEVKELQADAVVLRYVGSCRNDGTLLRPEHLVYMLEQVSGRELQLVDIQRNQLILAIG